MLLIRHRSQCHTDILSAFPVKTSKEGYEPTAMFSTGCPLPEKKRTTPVLKINAEMQSALRTLVLPRNRKAMAELTGR